MFAVGCGSRNPTKTNGTHEDKRFDFLTDDIPTQELYARHRNDPPAMIAALRDALRTDSRPTVRQNAIVALSAPKDPSTLDDFIFALDDPNPDVVSEAGFTIAGRLTDITLPDQARARAIDALRKHAAALRAAFDSPRERARFDVMMALEAIVDRDLDLAKPLRDEGSLIRSEGLKLAAARADADQRLSVHDADELVAFVHRNTDAQLHDDAVALLVRFAPDRAKPLLISAIADDTIGYQGLKHVVALHLTQAVPAIISYIKSHPGHWSKEHLDTLAAFHAACAAPLMSELFANETDKVRLSFIRDALRTLSDRQDADDATLLAWAKQQAPDASPCQ